MCDKNANIIEDICSFDDNIKVVAHTLYKKIKCRKPNPQEFLSYIDIAKIYYCEKIKCSDYKCNDEELEDNSLWVAVQVLCNPRIELLELIYIFIDDMDDSYQLSITDVVEAQKYKSLEHPKTGELVKDYESHVFPFFKVHYESLREC